MLLLNNHRGRGESIDDVEVLMNLVDWLQERGLEP
jgi:hypothetical protein